MSNLDLTILESNVLSLDANAPVDALLDIRERARAARERLREIERLIEERSIEYIDAHGPLTVGDTLYVVGEDKDQKPRQKPAQTAEALLQILGGDWAAFGECLASGAFKHGAVRQRCTEAGCPERYDALFETVIRRKVDGKPIRKVKSIPSFIRKEAAHGAA